jgi:hypothetical protein
VRERELRCPACEGEMVFEVPPCADGHDDCPELVCSGCGAAEVLAPVTLRYWFRGTGARSNRIAPLQRRAAA